MLFPPLARAGLDNIRPIIVVVSDLGIIPTALLDVIIRAVSDRIDDDVRLGQIVEHAFEIRLLARRIDAVGEHDDRLSPGDICQPLIQHLVHRVIK